MKNIKRLAAVLRTAGIILLALALVATFYSLASGGATWTPMRDKLVSVGADAGFGARLGFDRQVYAAMSEAAGNKELTAAQRAQAVAPYFTSFAEAGAQAEAVKKEADAQAAITYFETEFDAVSFMNTYSVREGLADEKLLTELFDYLDGLAAPAPKGGKKLPNLKLADNRAGFETYYAAFAEQNGEEAGSFAQFTQTVAEMVKAEIAKGEKITNATDWMNANLTAEAYMAAKAELAGAQAGEAAASVLDSFAALAEKKAAGEAVEFDAFFEGEYANLQAVYAEETLPEYALFVPCLKGLIESATFDGSYVSVYSALQSAQKAAQENSFSAFMKGFGADLVATADRGASIPVVGVFWKIVSLNLELAIGGVVLLVLSKAADYALSRALVAKREKRKVNAEKDVLLRVNNLKQYFRNGDYVTKAVDDVSFYVKKGEVFGLVGESGCGKTTTGRTIINLYDPTEGDVYFQGLRISSNQNGLPVLIRQLRQETAAKTAEMRKDFEARMKAEPAKAAQLKQELKAKTKELKKQLSDKIEAAQISAIESHEEKSRCVKLYRQMKQAELTEEFKKNSEGKSGAELEELKAKYEIEMKVAAKDNIMTKMQMIFQDPVASINPRMTVHEIIAEGMVIRGIKDKKYIDEKVYEMLELVGLVREHADRYPHEFSGGQKQRIGIARAIVMEPDLIIADEPISALDVSIQAQVINLLNDLREKMGLTIMFIAHNLSVVKYFSDRIAVMYFGKIVEMTTSDELFEHPLHPYTKSLLSAIPYPDPHYEKQRKRIEYNPAQAHDYSTDKPTMREITPGHFIYCNEKEFAAYKKELGI